MDCFFETHKYAPEMNRMYIQPKPRAAAVHVKGFTPQTHAGMSDMMTREIHKEMVKQYRNHTRRRLLIHHCHIVKYTYTLTTAAGESASIEGQSRAHMSLGECLAEIERRAPQGEQTELFTAEGYKPATGKRVITSARVYFKRKGNK